MAKGREESYPQRIIIVGGGFAGVSAYRTLSACRDGSYELLLISDNALFVHIPLIHEVATCAIPGSVISWPLSKYIACPQTELLCGRVVAVDADKKYITVDAKGERLTFSFDWLVMATGSSPALPNIPGGAEHLFQLRSLADAEKLKAHILEQFQKAKKANTRAEKEEQLTFISVGAGVTGVELVGELSDLFSKELAKKYPDLCDFARVILINKGEEITLGGNAWLGAKASERLAQLPCVAVSASTDILEITDRGIKTSKGYIPSRTIVWTGGVSGSPVQTTSQPPVSHDDRGRIFVTPTLNLEGKEHIFVVGDTAHVPKEGGGSYGMQAQFAVRQGRHAAKNILKMLQGKKPTSFRVQARGFLVPIGKHYGIAEIFGYKFSGLLAWHLAHIIYVFSVVRWDLKFRVAWEWLYHLMYRRKTL